MNFRACVAIGLFLLPAITFGEELQGAAKTLAEIEQQAQTLVANQKAQPTPTLADWKSQLAKYHTQVKSLDAEEQAQRWLELLEKLLALRESQKHQGYAAYYEIQGQATEWLKVVPPPSAWPVLQKLVEAKPIPEDKRAAQAVHVTRLIVHTLINDEAACKSDQEQIMKLNSQPAAESQSSIPALPSPELISEDDLEASELQVRPDVGNFPGGYQQAVVVRDFGKTPEEIAANFEKYVSDKSTTEFYVPDLVAVLGLEKAEPLVKKALLGSSGSFFGKLLGRQQPIVINIVGDETRKLAKKIATENPKGVRAPIWDLIETPEDGALYEAFAKRFGEKTPWSNMDDQQKRAANCYLAKLLDDNRIEDAKKVVTKRFKDTLADENRWGGVEILGEDDSRKPLLEESRSKKLFGILDEMLVADARSFPWNDYFEVADKSDQEDEALKRGRELLEKQKLAAADRRQVAFQLYTACLSQELVDEAVALLRQHLTLRVTDPDPNHRGPSTEDPISCALRLSELGRLVGNPDWEKEGLDLAIKLHEESPDHEFYGDGGNHEEKIVKRLLAMNRDAEAERLLTRSLARWQTQPDPDGSEPHAFAYSIGGPAKVLACLSAVYASSGRDEDILILLEKAPWWKEKDLSKLLNCDFGDTPLALMAAKGLASAGKKEEAKKILQSVIAQKPGFDPPYEMLLALDPQVAVALFDRAAFNDPYEERPLIWKAKYLLEQGNVAEAGKTIRQAILIDPSDGEQGKNRRMLAYSVLADVIEREGDAEGAKTFRKAVAAIRQSEKADDYHAAGLKRRARALYKEALELFSDAYCIQSRLAIQLYEEGLTEEAAKHYQRAYELMPDSFGMIESHCFGCEGAFRGPLAQSLAEQVFEGLLQKHPEKPQVHYLLGYLRSAQGRHEEAIKHYQDAVKLAPNYLNAWAKLEGLLEDKDPAPALLDECIQARLRLDPLQKHGHATFNKARDLKKLWELLEASAERKTAAPEELLPLPASAAALEQERKAAEERAKNDPERSYIANRSFSMSTDYSNSNERLIPGEVIASNDRFKDIAELLIPNR